MEIEKNTPSEIRQLVLRYLLDELPAEERADIDSALIANQEFSDVFQEAHWDLVDACAANELPSEMKKRVESAIFLKKIDTHRSQELKERPAVSHNRPKFRIYFFASALAACVLLAVVMLRWHQQPLPQPEQLPHIAASTPASKQPLPSQADEKSNPVSRSSASAADLMAVVMPNEVMRGPATIPIHIAPGTHRIKVQWPLPAGSTSKAWDLEIVSASSSKTIVNQHGALESVGDIRIAQFVFPVSILGDGQYVFHLRAAGMPGVPPIAESSVRIFHEAAN